MRAKTFRERSGTVATRGRQSTAEKVQHAMRRNREDRQRANDMKTYRQAFAAIDGDGSGRVDPTEIVKFAARMGKRVDTRRFWRLFNELDIDNSAGTHSVGIYVLVGVCTPLIPRWGPDNNDVTPAPLATDLDFQEFTAVMDAMDKKVEAERRLRMAQAKAESPSLKGKGSSADSHQDAETAEVHEEQTANRQFTPPLHPKSRKAGLDTGRRSGGEPTAGGHGNGSRFMGAIIEQKRQLADIYSSLVALRENAASAKLGSFAEAEGAEMRRARATERKHQQHLASLEVADPVQSSGHLSNQSVMERFAKLFAIQEKNLEALAAIEP
jgi:hypothetical protein